MRLSFEKSRISSGSTLLVGLFLLPLVVLTFVFRDLLFFGGFFSNGDVILANLPFLFYRGMSDTLIVQNIFSGFPLFVSTNSVWFYPLGTFLFSHLASTTAYIVLDVGYIVLAYAFTYLYARKMRLSPLAAVFAAMIFVFSGQLMLWAPSVVMTSYYFLLPVSLYLLELALEKGSWVRVALLSVLGALLGTGWLTSHVQFVIYIHTFFLVYAAARLLFQKVRAWRTACISIGIPYAISFLVGLPMIWAILSFQHETLRAGGVSLAQSVASGYMPWDFIRYLLPFWSVGFISTGEPNLYIGIVPMLVLLIVFFSYKHIEHRHAPLYLWTLLFCLTASVYYSPLGIALHHLPLWNALRDAPRIMFIGSWAEAMLAGIGLDYMIARWREIDFYRTRGVLIVTRIFLYACLPVAVAFSLVHIFFLRMIEARLDGYFLTHMYARTTHLPPAHYLKLIGIYTHQIIDQFSLFDSSMIFLLLFFALSLVLLKNQRKISGNEFAALAIALTAINFASVYANHIPTVQADRIFEPPHTVRTIRFLQKGDPSPFRVFSIFPGQTLYNDTIACPRSEEETLRLEQELLQPNIGMFYNVDSVDGYDNYMPARVSEAIGFIGSERSFAAQALVSRAIPQERKLQEIIARKNVLRAMNVRYVVTAIPITDPSFQLADSLSIGSCHDTVLLYRLVETWPRYFVTNNFKNSADGTHDAASMLDELNGYANPVVLFDDASRVPVRTNADIHTVQVAPTFDTLGMQFQKVRCEASCALLAGNTFLSGWTAMVDGRPSPILRANYLYMAVVLSPGVHDVEFSYQKPLYEDAFSAMLRL